MSIKIKEITEKQIWEDFVTSQEEYSFLHSWAWGEFNKSMGDKVWRLGIYNNQKLVAVALTIKVHAKKGNFLFVPHGPVFAESEKITNNQETKNKSPLPSGSRFAGQITNSKFQILNELTNYLKNLANQEKCVFIRISPILENLDDNKKIFKELGFRDAPIYMHAETTWMLELTKSEEDLLYGMRKNTRNLVRRAKKEGIEVTKSSDFDAIDKFMKLYKETAGNHSFVPFSERYIESEIKAFNQEENCSADVYLAKYKNQYIAGAVIVFYGNSAYYHHGASSFEHRKIPASYLIQWQAIKDAKKEGRSYYNFWGISADEEDRKHPWYGLTLFKKGFGGFRKDYLHAQDLTTSPLYWASYAVDKVRLWKRGV